MQTNGQIPNARFSIKPAETETKVVVSACRRVETGSSVSPVRLIHRSPPTTTARTQKGDAGYYKLQGHLLPRLTWQSTRHSRGRDYLQELRTRSNLRASGPFARARPRLRRKVDIQSSVANKVGSMG